MPELVILPVIQHHSSLAGTKLYCLMAQGGTTCAELLCSHAPTCGWTSDLFTACLMPPRHPYIMHSSQIKKCRRWDADLSCDQLIDGWLDAVRPVTSLQRLKPLVTRTQAHTCPLINTLCGHVDSLTEGFMSHSTQNRSLRRHSSKPILVRKKLHLRQRKQMTWEQNGKKTRKAKLNVKKTKT